MRATLFTDGGSRGNPGPAGIGFVLKISDKGMDELVEYKEYIGKATNNQAEYRALLAGLEEAVERGVKELTCFLDSELVVKQVKGLYKMKNPGLRPLWEQVCGLKDDFSKIDFKHVPRAKNEEADRLVNEALDAVG